MLARPNRRYHDAICRSRGQRRRAGAGASAHADRDTVAIAGVPTTEEQLRAVLGRLLTEEHLLGQIARASRGSWRASAWLLEKQWPEKWGPRASHVDERPRADDGDGFWQELDELAARRRQHPPVAPSEPGSRR